jgi:hypothetical protein
VGVEGAVGGIFRVEGVEEPLEDGEICRVGAGCWVVFVAEALEERSEYRIVPDGSAIRLSGIASTQVGDPLAHRLERFLDCITSDRFLGGVGLSVAEAEDQEVAELVLAGRDVREVRGVVVFLAEGGPSPEDGVVGLACFPGCGLGGVLQSSAEVSLETCLDCR